MGTSWPLLRDRDVVAKDPENGIAAALDEMHELLRATCSSSASHRLSAVRYTECRIALLQSEVRPALPGFLVQCVSLSKFHDFINLYHPSVSARLSFVDEAIGAAKTQLGARKNIDVFSDPDF